MKRKFEHIWRYYCEKCDAIKSYNQKHSKRKISVLAYNLETILTEKLEIIISRGDQSTRSRYYYDIYILHKLQAAGIDSIVLKQAFTATCKKRKSIHLIEGSEKIILDVKGQPGNE